MDKMNSEKTTATNPSPERRGNMARCYKAKKKRKKTRKTRGGLSRTHDGKPVEGTPLWTSLDHSEAGHSKLEPSGKGERGGAETTRFNRGNAGREGSLIGVTKSAGPAAAKGEPRRMMVLKGNTELVKRTVAE